MCRWPKPGRRIRIIIKFFVVGWINACFMSNEATKEFAAKRMNDGIQEALVGNRVEDIEDVRTGRTYIVLTKDEGLVYKRIYGSKKDEDTLQLVSDNKAYDPYYVSKKDVLELWEFTCSINTQEYDEKELKLSSIMRMFQDLKIELEAIRAL